MFRILFYGCFSGVLLKCMMILMFLMVVIIVVLFFRLKVMVFLWVCRFWIGVILVSCSLCVSGVRFRCNLLFS